MIAQRTLILALLSCVLAACGGGGGGGGGTGTNQPPTTPPTTPPGGDPPSNPPPPSGPSADELSAQNAKLRIYQDGNLLSIVWEDTFDNERGYQLQRRGEDNQWQAVGAVIAAGNGGFLEWLPILSASGTYRFVALLENGALPLHAAVNETEFPIDIGPSPITITVDQSEPVRGDLQVSVQNAGPALSVTYQLDNMEVAASSSGGTFPATLPAQRLLDGPRTLTALVQKTAGFWMFIDRPLQANNPEPAVVLNVGSSSTNPDGPMIFSARATAAGGIASVAFFANDNPVSVVTTTDARGRYIANIDRRSLPSGPNVFRAVATDYYGATVSMEQRFSIDHYPSLEVTGLFDGMIAANGSVDVRATFADDTAGATLTVLVGGHRLVQTQSSPLVASYSLADVAPGEYPLVVRVRDVTGKVNVRTYQLIVSPTGLAYELIATDAGQLVATGEGALLYKKHSGETVYRTATGTQTQLPPASAGFQQYWLSEGRIVARGNQHVYVIDPNGQPIDLAPNDFAVTVAPKVHGPWVSWSQSNAFRLYDLRTDTLHSVQLASSITSISGYDLDPTPGNERLLLSASMNGVPGIYSHSLATDTTQLLLSGPANGLHSDGIRMSWVSGTGSGAPLMAAPVNNPTASTALDTSVALFELADGLVYWRDASSVLKVNDGSTTTQLTGFQIGVRHEVRDDRILFRNDDQMLVWSAGGGERVWLEAVAWDAIQSGGVAYFLTGSTGRTLYRVTLP